MDHGSHRKLNTQSVCCRQIFVHLIFVVHLPHENTLTTNSSQITVYLLFVLWPASAPQAVGVSAPEFVPSSLLGGLPQKRGFLAGSLVLESRVELIALIWSLYKLLGLLGEVSTKKVWSCLCKMLVTPGQT